jgi:hypothetical protein
MLYHLPDMLVPGEAARLRRALSETLKQTFKELLNSIQ